MNIKTLFIFELTRDKHAYIRTIIAAVAHSNDRLLTILANGLRAPTIVALNHILLF